MHFSEGPGSGSVIWIIGPIFVWACKTAHKDFIVWTDDAWAAFKLFEKPPMRAPSLGLPDPTGSFELFFMPRMAQLLVSSHGYGAVDSGSSQIDSGTKQDDFCTVDGTTAGLGAKGGALPAYQVDPQTHL